MAPGRVLALIILLFSNSALAQSIYQDSLLNRELLKFTLIHGEPLKLFPPGSCGIARKPPPAVLAQYECKMNVPNPPQPKSSKKSVAHVLEVEAFIDNDNKFMGLVPDGANDLGMTNRMGVSAKRTSADGKISYGIDIASTLYTKTIDSRTVFPALSNQTDVRTYDPKSGVLLSTERRTEDFAEMPTRAVSNLGDEQKEMVSFVDESRIQAHFKAGKELYIRGVLGFAKRDRDPTKKSVGVSVQDWWHNRLLHIYRYDYTSPGREQAKLTPFHDSWSYEEYEEPQTYTDENGNVIHVVDPNHELEMVSRVEEDRTRWRVERPEVKAEKNKANVASKSAIAGLAAGVSREIEFSGQCRMTWSSEVGFQLESEGRHAVGPNSRIFAGGQAKLDMGKHQNGESKASVVVTQALAYFPSPIPDRTSFAGQTDVEIAKNGKRVSPYLVFQVPYGRQLYDEFNDVDTTMRIGVRIRVRGR